MAASEIFFSQARSHCTKLSHICVLLRYASSPLTRSIKDLEFCNSKISSRFSLLGFPRAFASSSTTDSDPQQENRAEDSAKTRRAAASIKPVSYAAKPKESSESASEGEDSTPVQRSERLRPPRRERDTGNADRRQAGDDSEQAVGDSSRSWTREDIRYVKAVPSISPVSYPSKVAPLPEDRVSVEGAPEDEKKEDDKEEDSQLEEERRKIEAKLRLRRVLRDEDETVPFPTLIKVENKKPKVVLDLQDAIREVKANAKRNFIETVEAHVNLGIDHRRSDQVIRGVTVLPHGTGKVVRIAVFAEGLAADEARAAGADIVGGDELIEEIRKGGKPNFDKCISTPTFMPRLAKIGKILGTRGLMPNPKMGSVTSDVATAVKEAKGGLINFRTHKTSSVHVGLGKVNFSEEALRENVGCFVNALLLAKPTGLKKSSKYAGYMNSFTLCSTMGPGFPVSIQSLSIAADYYNKLQQAKR